MDKGGNSRPMCKWHPRQQGEGVCAQCLRVSLEKLAAYQREYQESVDLQSEAFASSSLTDFSREKDGNFHLYHPNYQSVSYRARSKKEPSGQDVRSRGGFIPQEASTSESQKLKDAASRSKHKLSWGGAVHRIALIRSAFTSLWRSERGPDEADEKRKESSSCAGGKYPRRPNGQNSAEEAQTAPAVHSVNGERHKARGEKLTPPDSDHVGGNEELRRTASSMKVNLWGEGGSSFSLSKLAHRSSNGDDYQMRWRRSKSSREAKRRSADAAAADLDGPRTPDGHKPYHDAQSPHPAPHASSKSSPWRFFSRSASRRSPHRGAGGGSAKPDRSEMPKSAVTPNNAQLSTPSGSRSNPVSRGVSPKPNPTMTACKSVLSSPSMAKLDARTPVSHGSKSTSWSRMLSPSSSKPSPLYLAARVKERKGDNCGRDLDLPHESLTDLRPSDARDKGVSLPASNANMLAPPQVGEECGPSSLPTKSLSLGPAASADTKTDRTPSVPPGQKVNRPRAALVHATRSPVYRRADLPRGASDPVRSSSPGRSAETPVYRTGMGKASFAS